MGSFEQWIADNSLVVVGIFGALFVGVMILMMVMGAKKKAKKKRLMQENPDLAEMVFDNAVALPHPVSGAMGRSEGYTLYSVNGQEPRIFGSSVLVPSGEVTLDYEFCFQTVGKAFATSFGRDTYKFNVEPGKRYYITYNYLEKVMEHKEK